MSWKSMPNSPYCHSKGIGITIASKGENSKPEVKILLIPDKEMKMVPYLFVVMHFSFYIIKFFFFCS